MTTTPPQRYELQPPAAPRWGAKYDKPVIVPITPRKPPPRLAKTPHRRDQTPPPPPSHDRQTPDLADLASGLQTPPTTRHRTKRLRTTLAPPTPSSAQESPSKRRTSPRQSRILQADAQKMQTNHQELESHNSGISASILPTPSKTPKKRQSQFLAPASASTSRQLFSVHEEQDVESLFPTPKRSPRKRDGKAQTSHLASSLESFEEELEGQTQIQPIEEKIEVFTDMRDKQPEIDTSEDNPFYVDPTKPQPIIRPGRARTEGLARVVPDQYGLTRDNIDEGIDRELGITYVFRGTRVFKRFNEALPLSGALYNPPSLEARYARAGNHESTPAEATEYIAPVTRSSIKGRLLFPEVHAKNAEAQRKKFGNLEGGLSLADDDIEVPMMMTQESSITDEEADTEIDEDEFHGGSQYAPLPPIRQTRTSNRNKGKSPAKPQKSEWDTTDDESHPAPRTRKTCSSLPTTEVSHQPTLKASAPTTVFQATTTTILPASPATATPKKRISRQLRNTLLRDLEEKAETEFWDSPTGQKLTFTKLHSSSEPATPSAEMADPFDMETTTPLRGDGLEVSPSRKAGTRSRRAAERTGKGSEERGEAREVEIMSPGRKRKSGEYETGGRMGLRNQREVSKRLKMAESLEGGIDDVETEIEG